MAATGAYAPVYHGYRRAVLTGAAVAVAAAVVALALGSIQAAIFIPVGTALGVVNSARVREVAPKVVAEGAINRRVLGMSSGKRLAWITLAVLIIAVAFRPAGWTVVLGLAAFQVILVAVTAAPMMREVRQG